MIELEILEFTVSGEKCLLFRVVWELVGVIGQKNWGGGSLKLARDPILLYSIMFD